MFPGAPYSFVKEGEEEEEEKEDNVNSFVRAYSVCVGIPNNSGLRVNSSAFRRRLVYVF